MIVRVCFKVLKERGEPTHSPRSSQVLTGINTEPVQKSATPPVRTQRRGSRHEGEETDRDREDAGKRAGRCVAWRGVAWMLPGPSVRFNALLSGDSRPVLHPSLPLTELWQSVLPERVGKFLLCF